MGEAVVKSSVSNSAASIAQPVNVMVFPCLMEVTEEEYHRRIRWQVLVEARLGVWANLPAGMIPLLEWALRELETRPIRFEQLPMFEYRVWPVQTETNLVTGTVRRMQRVLLLTIEMQR